MKKWIGIAFVVNAIPSAMNGFWITGSWPFSPLQHLLADLAQFVALPALTVALLVRLPEVRGDLNKLAWPATPTGFAGSLVTGVVTGVCGYWMFNGAAKLVAIAVESSPSAGLAPLYQFFSRRELAALYLAGTAALAEEFVFRYLPLAYLAPATVSDRRKWLMYASVACLLFGLIHWENGLPGMIESSLWGLTLGFMFWAFRNPITIVAAHFTADLIAFWPTSPSP